MILKINKANEVRSALNRAINETEKNMMVKKREFTLNLYSSLENNSNAIKKGNNLTT